MDDEPLLRLLHTKMLTELGCQVDGAEDGAAAWNALQITDYDLLTTDNRMPKMSGVELLEKIYEARMTLPTIMATGTFPEEEFTRSPWLQPEITLMKPYTPKEFLEGVEEVLFSPNGLREVPVPPPVCHIRPAANRLRL